MAYEPGDLAIKMDGYKLNIRSVGIIIHNGKVLLHKRKSADYYALLGGHVRIGESSQDTVKREMQEELGKEIEITGYISTIENFFELKDLKYHEIMFVYKAECRRGRRKRYSLWMDWYKRLRKMSLKTAKNYRCYKKWRISCTFNKWRLI